MRATLRETLFRLVSLSALLSMLWAVGWTRPAEAFETPDPWITTKIKVALLVDEGIVGREIHVDTREGRVSLYGRAASRAEKQQAQEQAWGIEGVREVRNLIQVVPAAQEEAVAKSDAETEQRVEQALDRNAELVNSDIEVASVVNGLVLLSGKAASLSDHRLALETARSQQGVQRVATLIESPDPRADAQFWHEGGEQAQANPMKDFYITAAAKLRLLLNEVTPCWDIDVDTRSGVVTLFGAVPSEAAFAAAEAEVRHVLWVKGVENKLQVVPPQEKERVAAEDDAIRARVEIALQDRASIQGSTIDVDVSNRVVRLRGTVPSESDRVEAVTVARAAGGVYAVEDELRVGASTS